MSYSSVISLVGVLLFALGLYQEGVQSSNRLATLGIFLFCLGSTGHYICWPLFKDQTWEPKWHFNPHFVWFLLSACVSAASGYWLWRLGLNQ